MAKDEMGEDRVGEDEIGKDDLVAPTHANDSCCTGLFGRNHRYTPDPRPEYHPV